MKPHAAALDSLQAELNAVGGGAPLLHVFSLRHEFPNEWQSSLEWTT
jgi:hypothetical protein